MSEWSSAESLIVEAPRVLVAIAVAGSGVALLTADMGFQKVGPLIFRRFLSVAPCALTVLALISPSTPLLARAVMAAVFLISLVDAAEGLLVVAVLGPLGSYLAELLGFGQFRLTEAMLLSFIAAWLVQPSATGQGPRLPRYATTFGWLFGVLLVSLSAGVFWQLVRYPDILRTTVLALTESYFSHADSTGITEAARMLEGLAIAAAAIELFRRRPALARSLPIALAASATAAALAAGLLWFRIGPPGVLTRQGLMGHERLAAHVADLNASGAHFAMVLCLTLSMSVREHGRRRALWIAASVACAAGLWLSRSRTAEAALGLVLPAAALWATTVSWTRPRRIQLIGGALAAVLVVAAVGTWRIEQNPDYSEVGFRGQFVMSSFRIIGTHPWFGIGAGQYYRDSPLFLTPRLAWTYGFENAHNNFLQIATEAGIIGFALFAAWFAGGLQLAVSALLRSPRDWRLLGLTASIITFLGTCLGSHPLLVPEVALAVFLQFAVMASLGASSALTQPLARSDARRVPFATPAAFWPTLAVAGTLVFGVLPALTVAKPYAPVHLEEVDGLYYEAEFDEAGVPFRWTREYASIFVPATARRVELTLRAPAGTPRDQPVRVDITSGGAVLRHVLLGDAWKTVIVDLWPPQPPMAFNRINIKADPVSQANGRPVGIRVGDYRIARIAYEVMPARDGARQP